MWSLVAPKQMEYKNTRDALRVTIEQYEITRDHSHQTMNGEMYSTLKCLEKTGQGAS